MNFKIGDIVIIDGKNSRDTFVQQCSGMSGPIENIDVPSSSSYRKDVWYDVRTENAGVCICNIREIRSAEKNRWVE